VLRAAVFTLLVASVLSGAALAQRAGATFHGNAAGRPIRSGFGGQRGLTNRFLTRHGFARRDRFGSVFLAYGEPFGYEEPEAEATTNGPEPPVIIQRAQEPPIPKAQVIEIPRVANANAKVLPPTVFILTNGERLEARRFMLTANLLSVSIDRQRRTVPLELLDLNATLTTNHEHGIDLRIPDDRNEISVSF
jgi:hypothetical protein